ncbi:DUF2489 domain-containing protein [Marinomonas epiphytica]
MSITTFLVFLVVSLLVIAVSIWFIVRQIKLNKARAQKIKQGEERVREERNKRIDSIRVLLKAADSEEMNWIEASIRIKNLLDQLGVDLSEKGNISVFYQIEELTQHIPTHDQWKALPITARAKFLKEMDGYEEKYKNQLLEARTELLSYDFV